MLRSTDPARPQHGTEPVLGIDNPLDLPRTGTLDSGCAADTAAAARRWIEALVDADTLTAAGALLVPPFPTEMTAFRQRYIAEIVEQLEAAP